MRKLFQKRQFLYGLAAIVLVLLVFLLWPLPSSFNTTSIPPLRLLDRNGTLLYEVSNDTTSTPVSVDAILPEIITTLLATEDRTYYRHIGISVRGIMRAAYQNLVSGTVISGGSTITQQLVRNVLHPRHRGYLYKMKEALYAIKLEVHLSKEEILERYLNTAYFGHQAYGIAPASSVYFDKSLHQLSMGEVTLLIGLLQSPSYLDPYNNFEAAKKRQKTVVQSLIDTENISDEEADDIILQPITLASGKVNINAPHFAFWQIARLDETDTFGDVQTTIDLPLQTEIERIIDYQLEKLFDKNVNSAAVVVLDAKNGDILSMVGSSDFFNEELDGQVNVATALRQPGSALKPFTYALALQNGDTAATTVADTDIQLLTQEGNPYTPRNYDYEHHGLVRYREALANSYNIPAVKVLEKVGVRSLLNLLRAAGITTLTDTPEHYGLALTLGDGEVSLLELAKAYAIFPRGGKTLPLRSILNQESTEDSNNIISPETAWLIADILSDNQARAQQFGLSSPLYFEYPVAGKTGTTRNNRDNWLIGFTPYRIVGVWVGNADNTPMKGTSGITGAGPIFHDVMQVSMRNIPKETFKKPDSIIEKTVCELSGLLPGSTCPTTINEYFVRGTEPTEVDSMYQQIEIDTRNNMLATESCDRRFVTEQVFTVFPKELTKWAIEHGYRVPLTDYSPFCEPSDTKNTIEESWISIVKPAVGEGYLLDPLTPDSSEKIIFEAQASTDIKQADWYIDDEFLTTASAPDFRAEWQPSTGSFVVTIKADGLEDRVVISVEE